MMNGIEVGLPRWTCRLLQTVGRLVPLAERAEWWRSWHAELWHVHHHRRYRNTWMAADLAIGVTSDALWIRTESWKRRLVGTAGLCLMVLLASSVLALLMGALMSGGWKPLAGYVERHISCSLVGSVLVVFVAFATSPPKPQEQSSISRVGVLLRRQLFFGFKVLLVLMLAFLLSVDLSFTLHSELPNTADLFQLLDCVVLALVGLRWALQDQERRCKQCLRMLTTPARVGRPSRNLLEWNGTELRCRWGHGVLTVPEMEPAGVGRVGGSSGSTLGMKWFILLELHR